MLVNLKAIANQVSADKLMQLSRDNPDARFELNHEGQVIIMSPTGSNSGRRNTRLIFQVELWNVNSKLGVTFESSTGFILANGAVRSPDVSWIKFTRWNELTPQQQERFAPIDPDFVIELRSPTDKLADLQQKMEEYLTCGVRLGWLINPIDKQVEIYRQGQDKEILENPQTLSGEDILPGLTVDLSEIL
ncbi:MAG: Uma2 family endonuclease [Cyanobacteria bacterium P01_A01_bin.83]